MEQPEDTTGTAEKPMPAKSRAAKLVPIGIVVLVVVAAVIVLSQPSPGTRTATETSVSFVVSSAKAVETRTYPIRLLEGSDPDHEAAHIVDSVKGLPGVATATVDWSSGLVLVVEYDPEYIAEQQISQALTASGYLVAPGQ
jgi:copper chaperone CopZ